VEGGKPAVYFAVVIDLQDSPSSLSSTTSTSDGQSPYDQSLAWVVSRQLQDFRMLHQQLLEVDSLLL